MKSTKLPNERVLKQLQYGCLEVQIYQSYTQFSFFGDMGSNYESNVKPCIVELFSVDVADELEARGEFCNDGINIHMFPDYSWIRILHTVDMTPETYKALYSKVGSAAQAQNENKPVEFDRKKLLDLLKQLDTLELNLRYDSTLDRYATANDLEKITDQMREVLNQQTEKDKA